MRPPGELILGLGAKALFFGVDTSQTFDDFGLLFSALVTGLRSHKQW